MAARDLKLGETPAAKMLSAALQRASDERGLSLRQLAKVLGYKQAVVLSHMALGRVPIPIDRAEELAKVLGLNKGAFLRAVVSQRHPDVEWSLLDGVGADAAKGDPLAEELEAILGASLSELSKVHRRILREVVRDPNPERRWASVSELPLLELVRGERPRVREDGLSDVEYLALKRVFRG